MVRNYYKPNLANIWPLFDRFFFLQGSKYTSSYALIGGSHRVWTSLSLFVYRVEIFTCQMVFYEGKVQFELVFSF